MLRLILFVLAAVLVWLLFFSNFEKQRRIIAAVVLFVVSIVLMWVVSEQDKPRLGIVQSADLSVCELSMAYSYRTNYDLKLCLKNDHPTAKVRRVEFQVVATTCSEPSDATHESESSTSECTPLQVVSKSRPVNIAAGESVLIQDNLDFDQLERVAADQLKWQVELTRIEAVR